MRHFGQPDTSKEIWIDPSLVEVHPVGYSSSRGWPLEPPNELKHLKSSVSSDSLVEENRAADCHASLLSPAQQMKTGMTLEVEDLNEPRTVWPATVNRNIGGRLLVKYSLPGDVSASSSTADQCCYEWIFCLSPRLHWQGWAVKSSWSYKPPNKIRSLSEKWSAMAEAFRYSSAGKPWNFASEVRNHNFTIGDRVRVIDPVNPIILRTASVTEIVDDQRFVVCIEAHESELHDGKPIAPAGLLLSCDTGSVFPLEPDASSEDDKSTMIEKDGETVSESGFGPRMALEAVNPWKTDEICVAVVTAVECDGTLLRMRLYRSNSSSDVSDEFLVPSTSQELFPVGWCDSQGHALHAPVDGSETSDATVAAAASSGTLPDASANANEDPQSMTGSDPATGTAPMETEDTIQEDKCGSSGSVSYWCPKIYFNFRCFSGPLLSRIRVAALPRSVGPGPIGLMMKEVLSLLLNGAYKPGSVLKQLQGEPGDPLPSGTQLEPLKAKYRQTTYRGTVPMASTAKDVTDYCRWVCDKLQCCPYLFGPELVGDPCPHRCCILAKAVWQHKKKAPNWRHRRFVDILKSLPADGLAFLEGHAGKSGQNSGAMESAEHSDEDSDAQQTEQLQHQQHNNELASVADDPSVTRKRRGRPKKNPVSATHQQQQHHHQSLHRSRIGSPPSLRMKQGSGSLLRPLDLPREHPQPDKWRAGDVWRFLQSTDCRGLADRLLQQEVDGPSLLLLRPADVFDYVTLNSAMAFKLCHLIACLRLTYSNDDQSSYYWNDRHWTKQNKNRYLPIAFNSVFFPSRVTFAFPSSFFFL